MKHIKIVVAGKISFSCVSFQCTAAYPQESPNYSIAEGPKGVDLMVVRRHAITQCVGVPHFHFDSPSKFCFSIVKLWMSRWKGGWGRLVFAARCSHVTWQRRLVGLDSPLCNGTFTSPSKHFVLSLFVLLLLIVSQTWEYWWYHLWVLRMRKSTIGGQI